MHGVADEIMYPHHEFIFRISHQIQRSDHQMEENQSVFA